MEHNNNYTQIGTIDLNNDKRLNLLMQGGFLLVAAIGVLLIILFGLHKGGSVGTFSIVLFCLLFIAIHEVIHIIVMKIFSPEKIECKLQFPTFSVGCKHLFTKKQFVMAAAAPVVVLTCVLVVLFLAMPTEYKFLLSVLLVLNFAGAFGDYIQIYLTAKSPKGSYFQDDSEVTRIFTQNN